MNATVALSLLRGTLAANGLRLALTLACIALGVALAGAVHTIHSSALAEVERAARTLAGTADLEIRGPRSGFDDALFLEVAARPEVAVASPVVEVHAAVAGTSESVRVLGIDPFRAVRLQPGFLAQASATGSGTAASLLDENAIWLSPAAAARLGKAEDAPLELLAANGLRKYRVAGILAAMASAGDVAVMDIAAAQLHFGRIGRLSRIDVRLAQGQRGLSMELPPGVVVEPATAGADRAAAVSRAYRVNLDALALVALATGAFLVFSTLALQAARRRQEFALLRALGVTRRGIHAQLALEGLVIGALGAVAGTILGLVASRALLARHGADLGAGFFEAASADFSPDPLGLAFIALLGIAMSIGGALWVARSVARMPVAEALRDRAIDVPHGGGSGLRVAIGLFVIGIPLLFAPPILGLPLAGYVAIALWLAASVALVSPITRHLLHRLHPEHDAVAALALAQVRQLPGHLAASVAGIVVSASLCVAMVIMVFSFRASLEDWLGGVVGADLYVRAASAGDAASFDAGEQQRIARLPQVATVLPLRYERLALPGALTPFSLVARPIDARILAGFQAEPPGMPARGDEIPVWMSEAARDLHGWRVGERIELPLAARPAPVRIAGVIRDYSRTWGAAMIPLEDYRRLTGDTRANDVAVHLAPGADARAAAEAIRATLGNRPGIAIEEAAEVRRRSLALFDRTFAVTYALEAIAVLIGLAGVTSSFAALAWSRRREFGVLRFLGLRRGEILRMLALEGAAAGAVGALLGLLSGAAVSVVLVQVVNRQSFHWGMQVHWPWAALATLAGAIVVACAIGARLSAALAVRHEAVLAVKDDA